MKKLITPFFCFLAAMTFAQDPAVNWSVEGFVDKVFIENKGQFDGRNRLPGSEVLFAVDHGAVQIFFMKHGISYRFEEKYRNPDRKKGDNSKPKYLKKAEVFHMTWEGANPQVALEPQNARDDFHTYSFLDEDKAYYAFTDILGYEKLTYKNLYPGIDVEYVFHPETGIKYSVILHPGADASLFKMKFSDNANLSIDAEGKLILPTFLGCMIEHAPVTFYSGETSRLVASNFVQQGNTITFQLGNYLSSKTVIIDPWVQTPTLSNSNCVWECEKDANGNVYIIGGDVPMRLRKYNAAGTLQWTHNTPYDTSGGDWLGTLATDNAGNSYVTNGSNAAIQRVGTNGGPAAWSASGSIFPATEYWSVQFNCDQTKLVVGGTRLGAFPPAGSNGVIFDINTNNGSVISSINVASQRPGFLINDINEVRAITSSKNAKYYFLTLDTIGAINQNVSACSSTPLFKTNSTYNFGYKSENYRPNNGNSGICAIRANDQFVYSRSGTTVHKRSLTDGSIITTAAIPGGINTTSIGFNQPGTNGIDIDNCGNVYVGSGDRVIKYDGNLNPISSVNLPFRVFDVTVSTNGDIIVAGATGTSATVNRTGYVQSINMSACAPFALVCCDATICPAGPFCNTDAPVTLTRSTPGGTWSGPGVNPTTGLFSPAVAGVGTHTITYTISCGSDAITIVVNDCATLEVCIEQNGQYTVTGGTGPYTWQSGAPFQNCSGCTFSICNPFCPGFPDTTWTTFATTATATPPGTFPIRVRDSGINLLTINSATGLPNCSVVVCPTITVSVSSQSNITCAGANNGTATVSASGGASPYTYLWQPGSLTGATRNNLAAGTYSITATDANGCTGTGSVTITAPNALTLTTSKTDATCAGNNGSASIGVNGGTSPYSYLWSNAASTSTISNLPAGSYTVTVTDVNSCTASASVAVSSTGGPAVSATPTQVSCNGANDGAITLTVTGGSQPITFLWSNGAITQNISGLPGGNYSVTVTDGSSCNAVVNTTISEPTALTVTGTAVDAGCGTPNGSINITPTGGTAPFGYNWSNGSSAEDLTGLQAGGYAVTVTDSKGCTASASFTVGAPGNFTITLTADSASCQGVADGSITTTVNGGSAPFLYNWSTSATTQNLSGIAAGSYTVTVTDGNLCTVSATTLVSAPSFISATASITKVFCEGGNNGGIKLNPFGGTAPYTATWNNGQSGLSLTNLPPGVYFVTIMDANGCTKDTSFAIDALSEYTIEAVATDATCDGAPTGSATVNIINGNTPPYQFIWSNGDSTATIVNLSPGTYSVTVIDTIFCLRRDTIVVGAGASLIVEETVTPVSCPEAEDGSISLNVVNGSIPFNYAWNTGATSSSLTNIAAGTYSYTVTDFDNCAKSDTVLVYTDINNLECDTLIIYDVFSPNGDGRNDFWVIDGLAAYAENEMQIFNRWGSLVYEARPYNNDWDGISKKGEALPSATYYYILKLNDTKKTVYSGHITLIR